MHGEYPQMLLLWYTVKCMFCAPSVCHVELWQSVMKTQVYKQTKIIGDIKYFADTASLAFLTTEHSQQQNIFLNKNIAHFYIFFIKLQIKLMGASPSIKIKMLNVMMEQPFYVGWKHLVWRVKLIQ